MTNWKSRQVGRWLLFLNGVAFIIWLNLLAGSHPVRFDLTEEKRYSVSEPTKELLKSLDEVVYVEVYLEGELPSSWKRLQTSIREMLEEFAVYAGANIQFSFRDPASAGSVKSQNQFFLELARKGIQPTNLNFKRDGNTVERWIFPGAVVSYQGRETGVMLLKGTSGAGPDQVLNQSIEGLEFNLAFAIKELVSNERKRIGLIADHHTMDTVALAGFHQLLAEKYDVRPVRLARQTQPLSGFDAIILPKPAEAFTENEKYLIDQYIVNGGKALFFINALSVNIEEAAGPGTFAFPVEHNLTDLFFRYGFRINQNYVQDLNSGQLPVIVDNAGGQQQVRLFPWPYFPVINRFGQHPVVRNLDAQLLRFASTIDTVKADGIKKTPLMFTSERSRVVASPAKVSFNDMQGGINPASFNQGMLPVAYLLEGSFTSLYKNRSLPRGVNRSGFRENGMPSKIIVVADGDFIRNEVNPETEQPVDLGVDPYSQLTYANKDFIVNAIEYLTDDHGLILARNKEVKIRPLDKIKIEEQRTYWQVLNLAGPLLLLVLFGLAKAFVRKRKYTRFSDNHAHE